MRKLLEIDIGSNYGEKCYNDDSTMSRYQLHFIHTFVHAELFIQLGFEIFILQ